jgi:short-subunit dehydrogenase
MRDLAGANVLVSGASGGIGPHLARAFARAGANIAVSGRRVDALEALVAELAGMGVRAESIPADLADPANAASLIDRSESALGPIDVLVNNAGVEFAGAFASQPPEELRATIEINLSAPLLLTRRVLPGMLERGRGHVVFVASLAGKAPTPYEAVYAASKAGLIGLTRSLRVEYRAAPVGFSVVCPGFVAGDGMYQRMVEQGVTSNRILGETTTDKVAAAVLDAIRHDRSQVIESGAPIKPLLAMGELAPRALERIVVAAGVGKIFRAAAAARGRAD